MPAASSQTLQQNLPGREFFERLAGRLRELDLSVSFLDTDGNALTVPYFRGQYCRRMCGSEGGFLEEMGRLANKACREGRCEISNSSKGCCMLAVPVYQRRRLIGSALVCFPTLNTAESEEFIRACGQAHLDSPSMAELCRQEAVYTESQAGLLCQIVERSIRDEQAKEVAREELATLSTNLANTYEELSLLYSISSSMTVTHGTTDFFENLCGEVLEVMRLQAAVVVLHPPDGGDRVVSAGDLPVSEERIAEISQKYIAPRIDGKRAKTSDSNSGIRKQVPFSGMIDNQFTEHFGQIGDIDPDPEVAQIHTLVAAPLMNGRKYDGALIGINKLDGEFDSSDLKLIGSISGQAAVFLKNNRLYGDVQDLLMGVLYALTASIDAKDPYTSGHSRRVALISRKLAQLYGFDEHHVGRIYLAGLLHDIGKIGVPESVLRKAGKLTDPEYDLIKLHPGIGASILSGIRQMKDIIPAILHHHERLDGRGYPEGLPAGEIPIEALIVGLADSLDAMTSSRTYRSVMPLEAVVAEIQRCSGTQFDPRLVELLLSQDMEDLLMQIRADGVDKSHGGIIYANSVG